MFSFIILSVMSFRSLFCLRSLFPARGTTIEMYMKVDLVDLRASEVRHMVLLLLGFRWRLRGRSILLILAMTPVNRLLAT